MKRLLPLLLLPLLCVPFSALHAATFKIATLAPDGTPWMEALRGAAAEIERRTAGRVAFRFYPGGVMGNDKSVLRKIRLGQLQGGLLTGGGLAEIDPDAQVYGLPFAFRSLEEVDYVRERMDPQLIAGLERAGFIGFGISEGGFAYLFSRVPLHSVAELRRQKVWSPEGDQISRAAFEAIGVAPISLPLTDVLTGLQTGLIDTAANSPVGAIALQWHSRVKYLTNTPLIYTYGGLVVDAKPFRRLSDADQAAVREVMGGIFAELNRRGRQDNRDARTALVGQGIEVVEPSREEEREWHAITAKVVEGLSAEGLFSRRALDTLHGLLDDYRAGKR